MHLIHHRQVYGIHKSLASIHIHLQDYAQISICYITAHFRSYIKRTHSQNVDAISGNCTKSSRHAFYNACRNTRAFCLLQYGYPFRFRKRSEHVQFTFRDHRTHARPILWNIRSVSVSSGDLTPTSVTVHPYSFRWATTASFNGYPAKSSTYKNLFVFNRLHVNTSLYF